MLLEVEGFAGDTVRVGHEISLLVLGAEADRVQLGVTAPQPIGASPEEVRERIQAVQAQAGAGKRSKSGNV